MKRNLPKIWLYDISFYNVSKMALFSLFMRRKLLSDYLKISPLSLNFSITKHGKPMIVGYDNIEFNVSHSKNYWAMMISQNGEVGIDIEYHKERKNMEKIIANYFHMTEYKQYKKYKTINEKINFFYYIWTRKEAFSKFLGEGLSYNFSLNNLIENPISDMELITSQTLNKEKTLSLSISFRKVTYLNQLNIEGNVYSGLLNFNTLEQSYV